MRKIFTLALAVAAAFSVNAQQKAPGMINPQRISNQSIQAPLSNAKLVLNLEKENRKLHFFQKDHLVIDNASRANEVITEAPGEAQDYSVASTGWYPYWGSLYFWEMTGFTSISTDDNDVYIKNPISTLPLDTYIKGTKEGNKITVQLPQLLGTEFYDYPDWEMVCSYDYYITKLERYFYTYIDEETGDEVESFWYEEVTEDNFVTYTINEDGTIVLDSLCEEAYGEDGYPNMILGVTDIYTDHLTEEIEDEGWSGYGDCEQTFTVDNTLDNLIVLPEGVEMDPNWAFTSGDFIESAAAMVSVGFDDKYVYIQGISQMFPEALIRGEYNEETAQYTFPSCQILGYDSYYGLMFYWITTDYPTISEEGTFEDYSFIESVFNFDKKANRIVSAQDQIWWENAAEDRIYYLTGYSQPMLKLQNQDEQNGNPVNPKYNGFTEYYNAFNFTMPLTNVYGAILDQDRIYYNVYVNGDLWTYYGDEGAFYNKYTGEYYDEDAEFTDIPYSLAEDDYIYWYSSTDLDIAPTVEDPEAVTTLGIQVFFEGYDGEIYKSELITATKEGELDGITGVVCNTVKNVEYFNLAGMRVVNPSNGIYVKRCTMADGSVMVKKVSIR